MDSLLLTCRFIIVRLFLLTLSSLTTSAIRINCNYLTKQNSVVSECVIFDLEVKFPNETVSSISGNLPGVLNYEKVKTFRVKDSPRFEFIPTGIEKFFPNVERIEISRSGLKNLTQNNLKNFSNLKFLNLTSNQLDHLDSDVFEFNDKIEEIDLSENNLKSIRVASLKVLTNLKKLDLSNNLCINETAENEVELKRLKIKLIESCSQSSSTMSFDFFFYVVFFCLLAVLFAFLLIFLIKCVTGK